MIYITVFTPTYNRGYILERVYRCLQEQTFSAFEWLIIDDGSCDNTRELVEEWMMRGNTFPIHYVYQENQGKQKAINHALDLARGKLFFVVDSDDMLTKNALEKIDQWDQTLPENKKFCGFAGSDGDMSGEPTNPIFKEEYVDATFLNRYPESGQFIGYDRPWVFYTDVHRKYKYPEFKEETFVPEAVAWNRMARDGYQVRCFNDVIYLWEHQNDGLTKNIQNICAQNPWGYGVWQKEKAQYLEYSLKKRWKMYYSFYCDLKEKHSCREIALYISVPTIVIKMCAAVFCIKKMIR